MLKRYSKKEVVILKLMDKIALITGGAQGIGKETAKRFLQEGARVVICDYDDAAGLATLEEFGEEKLDFYKVDVTNSAQIGAVVQSTVEKYGKIDILVNNAGIT